MFVVAPEIYLPVDNSELLKLGDQRKHLVFRRLRQVVVPLSAPMLTWMGLQYLISSTIGLRSKSRIGSMVTYLGYGHLNIASDLSDGLGALFMISGYHRFVSIVVQKIALLGYIPKKSMNLDGFFD